MAKTKKNTKKKTAGSAGRQSKPRRLENTNKKEEDNNTLKSEVLLLLIILFGILSLLSLFDVCGVFGKYLSHLLFGLFGALAYIFPFYMIAASGFFIANPKNRKLRKQIILSIGMYWVLCSLFQWVMGDDIVNFWQNYTMCRDGHGGGGLFGGILSFGLSSLFGRAGSLMIILALLVLFFMLISGKQLFASLRRLYRDKEDDSEEFYEYEEEESVRTAPRAKKMDTYTFEKEDGKEAENSRDKKAERESNEQKEDEIRIIRSDVAETAIYEEELEEKFGKKEELKKQPKKETKKEEIKEEKEKEIEEIKKELAESVEKEMNYQTPPLHLLNRAETGGKTLGDDELTETAQKLKVTLENFGVGVRLGDISPGPSVTRYELIPDQGVKVSKITSLSDDIKLSLAAADIRIEAPIPGKAAVGIEVPNPERKMITLRELLESTEFTKAKSKVTFAVGKDISGKTIVTDIAKMPHLLIAGATGSGKSVLINTLIMSIIYKAKPSEVKMIMVDPKMVELTAYEGIPHLMIPVVKDPKKASAALSWAVAEMTKRYQKFADAGVRDIVSYNVKIKNQKEQKMPQIIIIVDEFADLMMVAPGEVEDAVCRLAQLARAAGIHLVLATQRPSVNVITGLIKANIPSRIALSVSSGIDSRTIIDTVGAEKLLGNGDMLFAPQNLPNSIRVQGAFVSDDERDKVVKFLKDHSNGPSYNTEVDAQIEATPVSGTKNGSANAAAPVTGMERDELFAEAGRFIIEKDKASIGLLQRMYRIGFNRAARIMDQLADAGVVSEEEGTKARNILMTKEQFEQFLEEQN